MLKSGCGSGCDGGAGVGGCSAGGGGGLNDHKEEELQPHSVKEQLPGVQYSVNSHPPWRSYSTSLSSFCYLFNSFFIVSDSILSPLSSMNGSFYLSIHKGSSDPPIGLWFVKIRY